MAKTPYRDSLLLRQMGTHGILMAKFENSKAVSIKTGQVITNLTRIQAHDAANFLSKARSLTTLGILAKDFVPSGVATGRTRIECNALVVELSNSVGDFLVSTSHNL